VMKLGIVAWVVLAPHGVTLMLADAVRFRL
jgi:hypothetical protein